MAHEQMGSEIMGLDRLAFLTLSSQLWWLWIELC